ncbi:Uncharacterised protein [Mycobacteroides abscessus subsp. abscessus]|nr:hypothetical protein B9M80_05240 [Mycobacteroides abscessus]SIM97718.1 Uncharacterised protein [Mycobacteroides abscessus subsp. abscessus]SKQ54663.1 Uncharacterised protein [Mycobacteroides abscessus subsp. abscessus]SKX24314.1 Uncharacterised protein [Mycobacteroides abscessus subsp. abscessus]
MGAFLPLQRSRLDSRVRTIQPGTPLKQPPSAYIGVDRQSGWRLSPLLPASLSFSHGDGAAIVVIQVAEVGNGTVVPVIGAVP